MLSEGNSLPNADIFLMTDDGPAKKNSNEVFTNGKIVIFAVPGAFTPTCTNHHFPSFLKNYDQIISKGVEKVFCVTVNDPFVTQAWSSANDPDSKIHVVCDPKIDFTNKIDMAVDLSDFGLNVRSKRYAIIVENLNILKVLIEPNLPEAKVSNAEEVLKFL